MSTHRRTVLGFCLALPLMAGGMARAAASESPETLIQAFNDGLLAAMKAGDAASFERRYAMLAPVIDRVFDLPTILRNCVGPRWSALAETERVALLAAFRHFTISSYVANFSGYAGEKFEILAPSPATTGETVIRTRIVLTQGEAARIDYVLRHDAEGVLPHDGGGWRVVDVLLDGSISRVAVTRSDFRAALNEGGVASLIASLVRKAEELAASREPT
jgi:phospholipid transport system substrate-binding protein